ncbi:ABC transporter ATP-binding protein [Listeria costaricensis]|uniref:ATP-binding cassette domain-containing protein n=1 Tax=Listeria costaricensis TaxID=2026604 RepID=UPI000C0786B6|nr:ABC transporter ATP-binding protein [Listeria costaricensis]
MKVEHLTKHLNGRILLDGIDLTLHKGEIVSLIGRNGSGKTTLLRSIMGFYSIQEGKVTIEGEALAEHPERKGQIFMLQDNLQLWQSYKIQTIRKLFEENYPNFDAEKLHRLMQELALPEEKRFREYSKGMKAVFGIILALSVGAEYLLLDEPLDGVDVITQKKIRHLLLKEMAAGQVGILISSHQLQELEPISDRVYLLREGRIEKSYHLESLRETGVKLQIALKTPKLPAFLTEKGRLVKNYGRVYTLLFPAISEELHQEILALEPIFIEEMPLDLEDIFFYHLAENGEVY